MLHMLDTQGFLFLCFPSITTFLFKDMLTIGLLFCFRWSDFFVYMISYVIKLADVRQIYRCTFFLYLSS